MLVQSGNIYNTVFNPVYEDIIDEYNKLDIFMREKLLKDPAYSEDYLPRIRGMDDNDYAAFVLRTRYVNYIQKSIQALTVLSTIEDPQVSGLTKKVEQFLFNTPLTRTNQNLPEFARTLSHELIFKGRVGVLVDSPANGGPPFFSVFSANNIVDWNYESDPITGKDRLTYVHLVQIGYNRNKGYSPLTRHLELILENNVYKVRETTDLNNIKTSKVYIPKVGPRPLSYIPFKIQNWDGSNPDFAATPPLMAVVNLSHQHYIKSNFLEVVQHTTSLPSIFVMTNMQRDEIQENLHISPFHVNILEADDKVSIIESAGSSANAVEKTLENIEQQISLQGARLFTSDANTGSENSSVFTTKARNEMTLIHAVQEALSDILVFGLPIYLRLNKKQLPKDLTKLKVQFIDKTIERNLDSRVLDSFLNLHEAGIYPLTSFYHVLKRGGYLDFSVSLEQFRDLVKNREEFTHSMVHGNLKTQAEALGIDPNAGNGGEKTPPTNPALKGNKGVNKPPKIKKNSGNNDGNPKTSPNFRRQKRRFNNRARSRQKQ